MCGQKLLVRGGPGNLLHANADAWILALELWDELGDLFSLGAHGPEADLDFGRTVSAAARGGKCE